MLINFETIELFLKSGNLRAAPLLRPDEPLEELDAYVPSLPELLRRFRVLVDDARNLANWLRILENFKIKTRNTTKISKYKIHFEKAKISKYDKISRFSKIFRNLVRRISAIFQVFTHFLQFSNRFRKILKNAALAVKFGVDTADILLFSIE